MRMLPKIVLVVTLSAFSMARVVAADDTSAATAGENVYVLGIEGMMCDQSCPAKVKESIKSLEGVREVQVDYEHKRAVVRTDPGVELTTQQIDTSFRNQGYFVSSLEVEKAK